MTDDNLLPDIVWAYCFNCGSSHLFEHTEKGWRCSNCESLRHFLPDWDSDDLDDLSCEQLQSRRLDGARIGEMSKILDCDLSCCFRMFRHPHNSNFLTDMFLGDEEDLEMAYLFSECTATEKSWKAELKASLESEASIDYADQDYIGGGGINIDCPIYQGLADPPWADAATDAALRLAGSGAEEMLREGEKENDTA